MQTFCKGKLYSIITYSDKQQFVNIVNDVKTYHERQERLTRGECVIYIKCSGKTLLGELWCKVLTKFGVRYVRKQYLRKEN